LGRRPYQDRGHIFTLLFFKQGLRPPLQGRHIKRGGSAAFKSFHSKAISFFAVVPYVVTQIIAGTLILPCFDTGFDKRPQLIGHGYVQDCHGEASFLAGQRYIITFMAKFAKSKPKESLRNFEEIDLLISFLKRMTSSGKRFLMSCRYE
jgi:hypothetical protein